MHLPLVLQTICLAAEILPLSYHPSSAPQILSSLCNEGFLSKLFFLAFHTLPASKLHSTASTWEWQTAAVWGWPGREWCPLGRRNNKGFERKGWGGRVCQGLGVETKSTFHIGILLSSKLFCLALVCFTWMEDALTSQMNFYFYRSSKTSVTLACVLTTELTAVFLLVFEDHGSRVPGTAG